MNRLEAFRACMDHQPVIDNANGRTDTGRIIGVRRRPPFGDEALVEWENGDRTTCFINHLSIEKRLTKNEHVRDTRN